MSADEIVKIKKLVPGKGSEKPSLPRIECVVAEYGQPVKKTFRGVWLISQTQPFVHRPEEGYDGDSRPVYWAIAQGERGGWLVLHAVDQAALLDGSASYSLLQRGPADRDAVGIPDDVIARAKYAAGMIHEEEIEL
jgi:hypothetical protein